MNDVGPKFIARVECADHIAIISGNDKKRVMQYSARIRSDDLKHQMINDVWEGKIDQVSTKEVADAYKCSLAKVRSILMPLVKGMGGDKRFKYDADRKGVLIHDGSVFTYSPMDIDGNGMSGGKKPKHYIWFCS